MKNSGTRDSEHESAAASLRRNQAWLSAQKDAFQAAVKGATLAEALGILARAAIRQIDGNARCGFFIANSEGTELRHVVGMPRLYGERVEGFKIGHDSLGCGLAVAIGRAVITPDVLLEPRWTSWLWLAREFDYRAIWSFPVETSAGRLIGTCAFYFREPRDATAQDLEFAATLTQTASIIISRSKEAEERALVALALRENEARLAAILNQVPGGVCLVDRDGRFLLRGGRLSHFLAGDYMPSREAETLQRWRGYNEDGSLLPPSEYPGHRAIRGETVTPGVDFIRTAEDGKETWIRVSAAPFRDAAGEIVGAVAVLQDIDEIKKSEQRHRESEARLQAAVDLVALGSFAYDRSTMTLAFDRRMKAMWGLPQDAHVDAAIWHNAIHCDDRARVGAALSDATAAGRDSVYEVEYRVIGITDGVERWISTRGNTEFENGVLRRFVGVALDVTERKRTDETNRVLIAELQHRTRNLMAVVSGLSEETIASSNSLEDFSGKFQERLAALSRVQGLLSRGELARVAIGELVQLELRALGAEPDGRRVTVEGPDVALPNRSVQILALALHELATNARKHGALATPEGRLALSWRTLESDLGRSLEIEWREHSPLARPTDTPSLHRGFGRTLIEEALPYQLDAQTRLQFEAEGLFCSVRIGIDSQQ